MTHPIRVIDNGTAYYYDDRDAEKPTRYEGNITIYAHWVKLGGTVPSWHPRELVEQIHEV